MKARLLALALLAVQAHAGAAPLSLAAGPTLAQVAAQLPPVPAGMARVWFLRQFEPSETLQTPMIYIDGKPLASSVPGTAFYRDFAPATYTFSVETCTRDFNQSSTLALIPGMVVPLEVQSLQSMQALDCLVPMNFYIRQIPARWVELYSTQLVFLGVR